MREDKPVPLERAALAYLASLERQERDRKDIEIINRNAARLNREAKDALEYQMFREESDPPNGAACTDVGAKHAVAPA